MITKILLSVILFLVVIVNVSAQQFTNASFENWSQQVQFDDPVPYITTNLHVYMANDSSNVKKSTDAHGGSYSAKLETVVVGPDTMSGGMFIGTPGFQTINGGTPLVTHPDSLKIWAKFNILPTDTANVVVMFKNNGAIIGSGGFKFFLNHRIFLNLNLRLTGCRLFFQIPLQ